MTADDRSGIKAIITEEAHAAAGSDLACQQVSPRSSLLPASLRVARGRLAEEGTKKR